MGSPRILITAAVHRPLEVISRRLIKPTLVYLESCAARVGLLHGLNDAVTAFLAVLGAGPGLAVLHDVLALRTVWVVSMLLQIRLIDPKSSG